MVAKHNYTRMSMKNFIYSWAVLFCTMMAIDGIWLSLMVQRFYKPYLHGIFSDEFKYGIALVFYLLYSAGVVYLIMLPAYQYQTNVYDLLLRGSVLGFIAYGAYDLTNQATLAHWPFIVTVVDMVWGACMTGVSTIISYKIIQTYFF